MFLEFIRGKRKFFKVRFITKWLYQWLYRDSTKVEAVEAVDTYILVVYAEVGSFWKRVIVRFVLSLMPCLIFYPDHKGCFSPYGLANLSSLLVFLINIDLQIDIFSV